MSDEEPVRGLDEEDPVHETDATDEKEAAALGEAPDVLYTFELSDGPYRLRRGLLLSVKDTWFHHIAEALTDSSTVVIHCLDRCPEVFRYAVGLLRHHQIHGQCLKQHQTSPDGQTVGQCLPTLSSRAAELELDFYNVEALYVRFTRSPMLEAYEDQTSRARDTRVPVPCTGSSPCLTTGYPAGYTGTDTAFWSSPSNQWQANTMSANSTNVHWDDRLGQWV